MNDLAKKQCIPCSGDTPPLDPLRIEELLPQLDAWRLDEHGHLARAYRFPDFASALALVVSVAEIAETEAHHPEIRFGWGHVDLEIWTHAIDGLTESDFVLAAKIDQAARRSP